MSKAKRNDLAPCELTTPGFEVVYTGSRELPEAEPSSDDLFSHAQDAEGNVYTKYSCWGFAQAKAETWGDEILCINAMQEDLGPLDDATRRIRVQIASLQCCDSGFPLTIDEILNAAGIGALPEPFFHAGCWLSMGSRSTQPRQAESMRTIEQVLRAYRDGTPQDELVGDHGHAKGFVDHVYQWLGSQEDLSAVQLLMFDRLLLPFDFLTNRTEDRQSVHDDCFESGGAGEVIDGQISELEDLPPIHANYKREFHENLKSITDSRKRGIYSVCGAMAHGLHHLSDCHHSTFRWLESWIHGIGSFSLEIPTRAAGVEAVRLGRLQFGYALGLDRWLQDVPLQCLLLDLGHQELGFDPKNEILRVYACLNDRSPVKEWLAACLWYTLVLERPASLCNWGHRHKKLMELTSAKGINVQEWMTGRLKGW